MKTLTKITTVAVMVSASAMANAQFAGGVLDNLPSVGLTVQSEEYYNGFPVTKQMIDISGYDFFVEKLKEQYKEKCSTGQYTSDAVTICSAKAAERWYTENFDEAKSHNPNLVSEDGGPAWYTYIGGALLLMWGLGKVFGTGNEETA